MTGVAIPERDIAGEAVQVEAEDNAHVLIDFGDGRLAVVTTGFTMQKYRSPAIELYGTHGVMQLLGDDWAPEGYELWRNGHGAWEIHAETDPRWPWTDGLRHLVRLHRATAASPVIRPEHGYHALEIMLGRAGRGRRRPRARDHEPVPGPRLRVARRSRSTTTAASTIRGQRCTTYSPASPRRRSTARPRSRSPPSPATSGATPRRARWPTGSTRRPARSTASCSACRSTARSATRTSSARCSAPTSGSACSRARSPSRTRRRARWSASRPAAASSSARTPGTTRSPATASR